MQTRLFFLLFLVVNAPGLTQPNTYQTTLNLQEPVVNVSDVDTVVYEWSTTKTSGIVTTFDVDDFTMRLYVDGALLYTDVVVVDGALQSFGGANRVFETDFFWIFNLNTGELEQMNNASLSSGFASTGLQYTVTDELTLPTDGIVEVRGFLNGLSSLGLPDLLETQTTVFYFYDGFESGDLSQWSFSTSLQSRRPAE